MIAMLFDLPTQDLRSQGAAATLTDVPNASDPGDGEQSFDTLLAVTLAAAQALPAPPGAPIALPSGAAEAPAEPEVVPGSAGVLPALRLQPPAPTRLGADAPAVTDAPTDLETVDPRGAPTIAATLRPHSVATEAPIAATQSVAAARGEAVGPIAAAPSAAPPSAVEVAPAGAAPTPALVEALPFGVPAPAAALASGTPAPVVAPPSGASAPVAPLSSAESTPAPTAELQAAQSALAAPTRSTPASESPRPATAKPPRAPLREPVSQAVEATETTTPADETVAAEAAGARPEQREASDASPLRALPDDPQSVSLDESASPDPGAADGHESSASQRQGGAELPVFATPDERTFSEAVARATRAPAAEPGRDPAAAPEIAHAARTGSISAEGLAVAQPVAADAAAPSVAASERSNATLHAPPAEAVASQVEWLSERGGGTARVRLDPPALGEIEIEVRMRGGVAEVVVHAREHATHALLNGERAAVTQILASRDVRMDDFTVVHEPTPRSDGFTSARDEQSPRDASSHADEGGQGDARRPARPHDGGVAVASGIAARVATPQPVPDSRLDLRV